MRSREHKELRELHRLYDKCAPVEVITLERGPELGICSCGRLLKHPAIHFNGRVTNGNLWVRITHADKKQLRRLPGYQKYIKEVRS